MAFFRDISEDKEEKMWKATLKAQCVLWFLEDGKPTSVQKKFRKKYGRNARSPDVKSIKIWAEKFKRLDPVTNGRNHRESRNSTGQQSSNKLKKIHISR